MGHDDQLCDAHTLFYGKWLCAVVYQRNQQFATIVAVPPAYTVNECNAVLGGKSGTWEDAQGNIRTGRSNSDSGRHLADLAGLNGQRRFRQGIQIVPALCAVARLGSCA